jgi:hypothetical protein
MKWFICFILIVINTNQSIQLEEYPDEMKFLSKEINILNTNFKGEDESNDSSLSFEQIVIKKR